MLCILADLVHLQFYLAPRVYIFRGKLLACTRPMHRQVENKIHFPDIMAQSSKNCNATDVAEMHIPASLLNKLHKSFDPSSFDDVKLVGQPGDNGPMFNFRSPFIDGKGVERQGQPPTTQIVASPEFISQLAAPAGNLCGTAGEGQFPAQTPKAAVQQCPFTKVAGADGNIKGLVETCAGIIASAIADDSSPEFKEIRDTHPAFEAGAEKICEEFLNPKSKFIAGEKLKLKWPVFNFDQTARLPKNPTEAAYRCAGKETHAISMSNLDNANIPDPDVYDRFKDVIVKELEAKKFDPRTYQPTQWFTADGTRILDPWNLNSKAIIMVTVRPNFSFFKCCISLNFSLASGRVVVLSNGPEYKSRNCDTTIDDKDALAELMALQKRATQVDMSEQDIAFAELAELQHTAIGSKRVGAFETSNAKEARIE